MKITYPVPAETTTMFVVLTEQRPHELRSVMSWRISRAYRRAALDALDTPRLELAAGRPGWVPWHRTRLSDSDLLKRIRHARHHVVVTSTAPPAAQPAAAQVARAAARAIADAYHGVIVDPLTGSTCGHCPRCAGECEEFRLGDDWLGWTTEEIHEPVPHLAATTCDERAGDLPPQAGLRVTTRGLGRFGLPEITMVSTACPHRLCAVAALQTVAEGLLAGHLTWAADNPQARCRVIDDHLRIAECDFAVLSGSPDPGGPDREGRPFQARLTRHVAEHSCLRVGRNGVGVDGKRDLLDAAAGNWKHHPVTQRLAG